MVGQNSQPMYVRFAAACSQVVGLSSTTSGVSPPVLSPPMLGPVPLRLSEPPLPLLPVAPCPPPVHPPFSPPPAEQAQEALQTATNQATDRRSMTLVWR